jgi:putative nucleotidyltransferase with HDIG domain
MHSIPSLNLAEWDPARAAARLELADTLQRNRDAIATAWIVSAGIDLSNAADLERYLRALISGLCEVLRDGDWTLCQTIIDTMAENRARAGSQPESVFQRALVFGRHAVRGFMRDDFQLVEDALLETLHECVFRYYESYQGMRIASENDRLYTRIIKSLVMALEARDPYTKGHSISVALLSQKLAQNLGMEHPNRAYLAGLLHDVGKVGVPDHILSKPGPLTPAEWGAMKAHPVTGANILQPIKLYPDVVSGVLAHHENFDGSGYPYGLVADDIPLIGRVIRVVDSFDAMTSTRVFRASRSVDDAMDQLRVHTRRDYDPDIVNALQAIVDAPTAIKELSIASLQIDITEYGT